VVVGNMSKGGPVGLKRESAAGQGERDVAIFLGWPKSKAERCNPPTAQTLQTLLYPMGGGGGGSLTPVR
jgi:hypothetical protein